MASRTFTPPEEAKNVIQINDQLTLMVTALYNSDKLSLLAGSRQRHVHASLDQAFTTLYDGYVTAGSRDNPIARPLSS